jgi:glycosyltransferase involved in cell wall biosynthesis
MRVVYLHQYFKTPAMGGGTRSFENALRLLAAGHSVEMITSDQAASPGSAKWRVTQEDGIRVHWANVRYDGRMGALRRIVAFLSFAWRATGRAIGLNGDVVFATSTPLTISIPAMIAAWIRRRPFVFEVRDLWPDVPIAVGALRSPLARWAALALERLTYWSAQRVVALAPGMRDDIVSKGVDASKVTVIPNGCDVDLFRPDPPGAAALRAATSWLERRPLVVFAGTFGAANGVEYLVRVAAAVRAADPNVRFLLIGGGPEVPLVRARAEELGVLGKSLFLFPPQPKHEIGRWLATADLAVALFTGPRAVWKDAVQNKFFDAIAAGCPVACNFDGWQTQVAINADVGFILDATDTEAAAAVLLSRLHDSAWLAGARLRARELAVTRFNRDALAGDFVQVIEDANARVTGRLPRTAW